MPPTILPPAQGFPLQVANAIGALRQMTTQQQMTFSNLSGQAVLNFGLAPGSSPAAIGMQFVNPTTGATVMFVGEASDGTIGMQFFDTGGNKIIQIDQAGMHLYDTSGDVLVELTSAGIDAGGVTLTNTGVDAGGVTLTDTGLTAGPVQVSTTGLAVYNGTTLEVLAGLLNASPAIYGLGILPYGGSQLQQVGGTIISGPGSLTTTATTPTSIPGSPAITAEIGPSGEAKVTVSGNAESNVASDYCYLGVSVDGGTTTNWANLESGNGQVTAGITATQMVTGLSTGTHTFQAKCWSSASANSAIAGSVYLIVEPL